MKKFYPTLAVLAACCSTFIATSAAAQDNRIYRCPNNEYTNQIKGRTDCKRVEGGNITIVRGGMPPAAGSGAASGGGGAAASAPRVDASAQRERDADAKAILESELRKAEARQADLQKSYNNGQPDKQGDEARNYQKYLDRVAEMKAAVERNQADIDGIKRELTRLGGAAPRP
jgi:hypothetical protein